MQDIESQLGELGFAGDDMVVPFQVDALDVRGRTVQLGPLLDTMLSRHDYPEPVARLLAEMVVLTALIGTSLKFSGKFTAQTKSDGPVDLLVADFSTPDALRAYARFDEDKLAASVVAGETAPEQLLGKGFLALTIDQGNFMQPYQGIVELDGRSLDEIATGYFRQSEQIPTTVKLGVAKLFARDGDQTRETWRAGGLVAQFLPEEPERMRQPDLHGGDGDDGQFSHDPDDAWTEASTLVETIDVDELTDPAVGAERLLYRLFHERGVTVYPAQAVYDRCSCSRGRILDVLKGFSAEEITESTTDGKVTVTCEFCSTSYEYTPDEIMNAIKA
ncbi:Hsp33 family molecular chaperone [Martelella sp. HB161492]|uniref:Hsp33 family molecular chaperone n=1 Tax=Martelella sp. HB161492 TaxID=2720726 RepID=UPI0015926C11|nr:Hsp33 family molecular chaperone [Martelella sp. HB161492]